MSIEKKDGDKIYENLGRMKKELIQTITGEVLARSAETFVQDINSFLVFGRGRRTGEYAASWGIKSISNNSVTIGTHKELLFLILEYGSAPHPIVGHPILHWRDEMGDHFAMYVRHPGTKPIPHLRPAIELLRIKIPQIVRQITQKYLPTS